MKRIIFALIIFATFSCSTNRYLLTDKTSEKKYLSEFIDKSVKDGKITNKPLLVIDGYAFKFEDLCKTKIQISKADIKDMVCLSKDTKGAEIYGNSGKDGVILIITNKIQDKSAETSSENKILFIVDGKEIPQSDYDLLVPANIESMEVIKEKKDIKKYTKKNYDGVVIIKLKK